MNPITAKEIIESEDIINKLNDVKGNLEGLRTVLQDVSKGEKLKLSEIVSTQGMEKAAERVRVLADAMEALRTAYKENEEMIKQLNGASTAAAEIRKKNAEAAKLEAEAVREQAKAERDLAKAQQQASTSAEKNAKAEEALENAIKLLNGEIDTQKLSYNQLSAMYSLMSARLKNMSAETINSTEDNRKLAAATKQVRDAMNDAQKAMGNYSLNVGRYHTAFDGLGFSIQQVLREIPSATTISQFFLAISNNIPMVADQIKAFRKEQEGIKKQLGELNEGTKEYMELQSKQMSLGQKIFKSIFGWQTAILAGILLLRKYGEQIINGIVSKISTLTRDMKLLREVNEEAANSVGELRANYTELQKEWRSLKTQTEKEDWVKNHTDALIELNVQMNNINDAEDAFNKNTANMQAAIDARARSIAAMKVASEKYEEAFKQRQKAEEDFSRGKMGASALLYSGIGAGMAEGSGTLTKEQMDAQERERQAFAKRKYDKAIEDAVKLEKDAYDIIMKWALPDVNNSGRRSATAKDKEIDYVDFFEQMMQVRHNIIQSEYEREIEEENNRAVLSKQALDNEYKEKLDSLKLYGKQQGLTQQEIDAKALALYQQYIAVDMANAEEHQRKLDEINQKWVEKYEKEKTEQTKNSIKLIDFETKANLDATNVRVRGIESEIHANEILVGNIKELEKELLRLLNLKTEGSTEEGIKAIDEAIQKTQSSIDKLANKMSFRQRATAKNFSLSNLIKNNVSEEGMESALIASGYTEEEVGIMKDLGQVEEIFGMKLDNTLNALKTWKDTTIDYIGDIIDAYIQLAEAKAEAAREETETAKEEYEKQKSLMDAGYANSMETAYMEYREKQELQKQAEAEAKQAQKAQQAIDTASQVSSLVTASANIWAQASKAGLMSPVVAGALLATMWGSFLVAKAKAMQVANYGDGGYEIMQGGSHASGHDIDLGVKNRNGKVMHVEGGEGLAIISNRAKRRYGHSAIESVINSINNGTFDVKAGELTRVTPMIVSRSSSVSLSKVENTLNDIKIGVNKQSYVTANGDIIEIEGSLKRTIHTR